MDLQNKIITIASKEEKSSTYGSMMKLKDEQGLTYSVFKTKKDGTVSVAWENMPSVGDTVEIGYVEEDKEYEGKPYKQRTVRSFNSDIGNGVANTQTARDEAPVASQRESSEAFGKRLAIHGMVNGMLAGGFDPDTVQQTLPQLFLLEEAIDEALAKPSGWNALGAKLKKEPVAEDIAQMAKEMEDEVNVDDLPF